MSVAVEATDFDAYYELLFRSDGLVIRIHRSVITEMQGLLQPTLPIIQRPIKQFGIPEFILPALNESWGYGPTLEPMIDDSNWASWMLRWPRAEGNATAAWPKLFTAAFTLQLLFAALCRPSEARATAKRGSLPQVMDVSLFLVRPSEGVSLGVTLTPETARWLRHFSSQPTTGTEMTEVAQAMHMVYDAVRGVESRSGEFECVLQGFRYLHLKVCGSLRPACLSPEPNQRPDANGYQLVPHNLGTLYELFALLAGLAKVHDLVRAWEHERGR